MYEQLISVLRHCGNEKVPCEGCPVHDECGYFDIGAARNMKEAADAIEELSKPRWVSVSERLPEECVPVLVCFDFKGRKSVDVAELWSDGGFHNYSDEYLTPEGRKHRKGTHWMPLPPAPEPPKEEA